MGSGFLSTFFDSGATFRVARRLSAEPEVRLFPLLAAEAAVFVQLSFEEPLSVV